MPFITNLSISKLITKIQEDLLCDKSICLIRLMMLFLSLCQKYFWYKFSWLKFYLVESFRRLNFSRWKCFASGNVSLVEMFRWWKCFAGGNVSLVEMFRWWKCFVGGNFSSVEMFCRWKFRHLAKFSSLSTNDIFTDKVCQI